MFNPPFPHATPLRRWLPPLLLALPGVLGLASLASAATLTVTNTGDSGAGSLRAAIIAAGGGDTIAFSAGAFPANGSTVIALTSGRLAVSKNLTIQGPGAGSVTVTDSVDGVFGVTGGSTANITVNISGLTLANGNGAAGTSNGSGGGIYAFDANLTLTGCVFSGNTAGGGGGAISASSSAVSLTGCTLSGNTAGGGGAISANNSAVSLTGCTLSGNTASDGGAIISTSSTTGNTVSLTNCTLVGNSTTMAGGNGGGIYNSGTQLTLTNCTLVGNTASSDPNSAGQGGGIYNTAAASVRSCIISGNTAGGGGSDVFGTVTSGGSNIVGDSNGASHGFTAPHDQIGVSPKLDPNGLRNNGGPTQTIALLPGSPALDGDFNGLTATDQRGFARPQGARSDIGAFELTVQAHILWRNPDGRATLWYVNADGSFGYSQDYGPYTDAGGTWQAVALATGPNGVSRILWRNPDGRATLWHVNPDGSFASSPPYGPYTDAGGTWQATAVSVGSDNVAHILWHHPDGRATLWQVNADDSFSISQIYGPYTDAGGTWQAVALATGPNGVSRILWRNPDGRATLWHVNPDGSFASSPPYGPYTDAGGTWQAVAVSVGSDNVAHILWHHPDGRATLWQVNADDSFSISQIYGPYTDAGGTWQAVALATGPNGVSRILWRNPDGRATLWHVYSDGTTDSSQPYGPYVDRGGMWQATADSAGP